MLTVRSLHTYYGNIHALKGVSLHVRSGEIVALIGANGAGKTTLVHSIAGLLKPQKGTILYKEEDITALAPEAVVQRGIALVPEGRQIFATLSVETNLEMGAFIHRNRRDQVQRDMGALLERFPILKERRRQLAGTLSGGEQQMLAISRALMARPDFLLLDEPSMGLAPLVIREIFAIIQRLRDEGRTILLIEQNARAALEIADRGYVMETGKVVLQGEGRELLVHREVQRAYLGKGSKEIWDA
ncbi:amino acid/amide ABC transporter ATP-binding protein 2, HAAT family [Desulfacinum hydrothermale DSM 13146]|uniref:Amino acid/amide ABC transporter ATP-binding protein 2, HAAT family n=1 Tax=Desulfacinum hydrothermale DSM 13146 TaxID=1121390 RepID=A0A1W1XBM4_9BACT|nr:ABC transporter ATP-binding protein [Desulfacinum hydrothermale]SMC20911.1 amino acid/amide ABC transporter ATP-binding protein 2, HAAT family [Desulfacinum hydrothermale DSM 13146]